MVEQRRCSGQLGRPAQLRSVQSFMRAALRLPLQPAIKDVLLAHSVIFIVLLSGGGRARVRAESFAIGPAAAAARPAAPVGALQGRLSAASPGGR
jgi:hypothetical protein